MEKRSLLFDGNEKKVFATDDPSLVIFHFKDVLTAYTGVKRAVLRHKGIVNNAISAYLFSFLEKNGVKTHFVERISDREQICRKIDPIPLEMIVCNYVNGPLTERLGMEEGTKPSDTIIDLRYNREELGEPLINDSEAIALGIVSKEELSGLYATAGKVLSLMDGLFTGAGLKLIDVKLEFGRDASGNIILCDEISPDTCRIWDASNDERLDKDRFRLDFGDIVASYTVIGQKLGALTE